MIAIICLERGMPSRVGSTDRPDYVPALCTHRPSLLPIGCSGEDSGLGVFTVWGFCFQIELWEIYSNLNT